MDFSQLHIKNNVVYITEETNSFSDVYIAVRQKEQRILTDKEVALLPKLKRNEWEFRVKSTERFINYIDSKKEALNILDVGCGNGWFTNAISNVSEKNKVIGLDVNRNELEQAARVFKRQNLQYVYCDIFKKESGFKQQFDIITLNSCVQYFPDFRKLISTLKMFLKPNGEIHIIDSPFYKASQITEAKQRTLNYYNKLGFPEMASHYFHHSIDNLDEFEHLYTNKHKLLNKILNKKDSPFPWIRFIKQ
ncbi:class I SAM-dependent methyltransferase [Winogradskyella echinorum]|uniref:Class I SAM-dependent methyltransferase n=1 Tax=Winogradskyella echinorum TaxID=538189 RepID=A0ABR6XZY3_9FLAO|nr:class I SAM-dependent methyltransferase [Winogradskyella echinorum]MBC3845570.1 class I SAM-dependent methyltransferase [Winogradskyella echinorum]MBC5749918.1 class I SAM-dependent methyltransferase [Winogradskyella echinorum]